jgi:hypothetical protein
MLYAHGWNLLLIKSFTSLFTTQSIKASIHIPDMKKEKYIKPLFMFLLHSLSVVRPPTFTRANPIVKNIIPSETGLKRLAGATAALILNCSYAPN